MVDVEYAPSAIHSAMSTPLTTYQLGGLPTAASEVVRVCRHDGGPIPEGVSIRQLAVAHDPRRNVFERRGVFCSMACVIGHLNESVRDGCHMVPMQFDHARSTYGIDPSAIGAARPLSMLAGAHGGHMDLDAWRTRDPNVLYTTVPESFAPSHVVLELRALHAHGAATTTTPASMTDPARVLWGGVPLDRDATEGDTPETRGLPRIATEVVERTMFDVYCHERDTSDVPPSATSPPRGKRARTTRRTTRRVRPQRGGADKRATAPSDMVEPRVSSPCPPAMQIQLPGAAPRTTPLTLASLGGIQSPTWDPAPPPVVHMDVDVVPRPPPRPSRSSRRAMTT